MKRKKINDIGEIWDGKKLLIKDFSNLDLSGIDLSEIPEKEWRNCIFSNTDFSNTNIKFRPNYLKTIIGKFHTSNDFLGIFIKNCDFSDNDLSYIQNFDFYSSNKKCYVYVESCNFKNTKLRVDINWYDLELDDYYLSLDYKDFYFVENLNCKINFIDINTIRKNPGLKLPSFRYIIATSSYIRDKEKGELHYNKKGLNLEQKKKIVNECESLLELDSQGYLKTFYELFKNKMDIEDKYNFFNRKIKGLYLKDIAIKNFPSSLLTCFDFSGNTFDNVIINNKFKDLLRFQDYFLYDFGDLKNTYKSLILPSIKYDSWKENKYAQRRIANGTISFLTKVYIELSRYCNGNCKFCRNNSFSKCKYDLEKIKETLNNIKTYLNIAVIGGGEPTLRLNDVKALHQSFMNINRLDFHMFTNGTNPSIINDNYVMENFKINLSRHAKDDIKNAKIFGISPINLMNKKDIEKLAIKNPEMTLSATCFKGGLDNLDDIISYVYFAKEIGVKKVLLTDLHKDISMGSNKVYEQSLNIESNVFDDVINYLKEKGLKSKYSIYATGGYVSYVFKDKDDFSITVQKYLTKEELDDYWVSAVKRSFDLSIEPAGNLYENWHQQSSPVKSIGSKKI